MENEIAQAIMEVKEQLSLNIQVQAIQILGIAICLIGIFWKIGRK